MQNDEITSWKVRLQNDEITSRIRRRLQLLLIQYGGSVAATENDLEAIEQDLDTLTRKLDSGVGISPADIDRLRRTSLASQEFLRSAAHDLQEPLRTVSAYAQIVGEELGETLDAEAKRHLGYVLSGAARMQQLLRDLGTYARTYAIEPDIEPVELGTVWAQVVGGVRARLEQAEAEIRCDELPRVAGDAALLRALFEHLLDNAIKFRAARPLRVHVRAERSSDEWCIAMSDNGIGFEQRLAERAFKPLQQLHPKGAYAGTGMGLAMSRRIAEIQGGSLSAEAEPDVGVTVYLMLKAADGPD